MCLRLPKNSNSSRGFWHAEVGACHRCWYIPCRVCADMHCLLGLLRFAAGDSAGGNLTLTSLAYLRERGQGSGKASSTPAPPAAADAAAREAPLQQTLAPAPSAAAATTPFHPPRAAIAISPAVDLSHTSGLTSVWGTPTSGSGAAGCCGGGSTGSVKGGTATSSSGSNGAALDPSLLKYDYIVRNKLNFTGTYAASCCHCAAT